MHSIAPGTSQGRCSSGNPRQARPHLDSEPGALCGVDHGAHAGQVAAWEDVRADEVAARAVRRVALVRPAYCLPARDSIQRVSGELPCRVCSNTGPAPAADTRPQRAQRWPGLTLFKGMELSRGGDNQ